MPLDADAAYQALTSRDARFDGRLFVGVTSTRIYCRPICRVRTPMRKNCRFFDTAAQAEAEAFRPCMKCRPEIAPGPGLAWTVMDASRTLALQAAAALDMAFGMAQEAVPAATPATASALPKNTIPAEPESAADTPSLAALARQLGVSSRHLRRIFAAEYGVTPVQYVQTRRLMLAKQLLTDSRMPVSEVALASGFRSLRRFNAAFAESYRMSPSRLRGDARMPDSPPKRPNGAKSVEADAPRPPAVCVTLAYRAPYDVPALLRFVTQRAIPGIEHVEGRRIRRTLRAGVVSGAPGWLEAEFDASAPVVRVRFAPQWAAASSSMIGAVRRWLDLDASPHAIDAALAALPGAPGLRLPGGIDAFELAVRAVLGQQVTVAGARTLAGRLVDRFGGPLPASPWPATALTFPAPAVLAATPVERIAELGIIRARAGAIVALAQAWGEIAAHIARPLAFSGGTGPLIERLCALPGIGPWTAHYIAMRALGWPDAFPPNDVAVLKAMKQLFDTATPREADVHARAWQPWRAYAVLRLWNSLEKST